MYSYGLIGNCQTSALVSDRGSIDWLCFPRPDSAPVFGRLLDENGGHFSVDPVIPASGRHSYTTNTNVLTTMITCEDGSQYKITDFCPRYQQHGRMYRPLSVYRVVEPLQGSPMIKVSCRPVQGWSKEPARPARGSSHFNWDIRGENLRLWTTMPLTYLADETPFVLKEKIHFVLAWSAGLEADIVDTVERAHDHTVDYWRTWVKHCAIPSLYQKETIRSALALKLHVYEDTGAILAALTTSLPEETGHERNWDYRLCWIRDSYFVLNAFHRMGHFEETEGFLRFLLGIAEVQTAVRDRLHPVYRLDQTLPLPELIHSAWGGFADSRPVRSGNQAAEHVQNDAYGELILAFAPIFFDERFIHLRTRDNERLLGDLARLCARSVSQPDAGLWELRDGWREHSFTNLMCWAGLERIQRIRKLNYLSDLDLDVTASLERAEAALKKSIVDGSLRNGPDDDTVDAALLLLPVLRYPDRDVAVATIDRIRAELRSGSENPASSFLYRYVRKDDFGTPQSAFLICSFWLVQALAASGRVDEARRVMDDALAAGNSVGLYGEHFDPRKLIQSGNFPQAYSHVGQINAAFAISPPWDQFL